ncbi:hypothetical protein D3C80_1925540 [compost metagenome]
MAATAIKISQPPKGPRYLRDRPLSCLFSRVRRQVSATYNMVMMQNRHVIARQASRGM